MAYIRLIHLLLRHASVLTFVASTFLICCLGFISTRHSLLNKDNYLISLVVDNPKLFSFEICLCADIFSNDVLQFILLVNSVFISYIFLFIFTWYSFFLGYFRVFIVCTNIWIFSFSGNVVNTKKVLFIWLSKFIYSVPKFQNYTYSYSCYFFLN